MSELKIITYNLWHGLSGEGFVAFGELEPAGRSLRRFQWQLQRLQELDADIIFLQEVNQLAHRADKLAQFLQMDQIHQLDQAGLKFLGWGLPYNLNTGLVILAKKKLKLKKLEGFKLSGPRLSLNQDLMSFQWKELRYALLGEITWNQKKYLLANTHLHHGLEMRPVLEELIHHELRRGQLRGSDAQEFLDQILVGQRRREMEVSVLLKHLNGIRGSIVLAGDFNEEPDSSLLQSFYDRGFVSGHDMDVMTWSPDENRENHRYSKNLQIPIKLKTLGQGARRTLTKIYKEWDARPRKIDYILAQGLVFKTNTQRIMDVPMDGLLGSDHFGLYARVTAPFE